MTAAEHRQLHLNAFNPGALSSSWVTEGSDPNAQWDLATHIHAAQAAERGLFDAIFLSDGQGLSHQDPTKGGAGVTRPEPLSLLSALISSTERIGLAATFSTTFNEPYNVARYVASLDQLSRGRAGWNVVTSQKPADALNFGNTQLPPHDLRYERSTEFIDVVKGLWRTWEPDAVVADRKTGTLVDRTKVHTLDHEGKYFSVRGPLAVPRSPQGEPLIFQAGSSEVGKNFAAKYADGVFTAQTNIPDAQAFYSDLKSRVSAAGRNPDHVQIIPGLRPTIVSTEEEGRRLLTEAYEHVDIDTQLVNLREFIGLDLSGVDLERPVNDEVWDSATDHFRSRVEVIRRYSREKGFSARETVLHSALSIGHGFLVGTPEEVAGYIEDWFRSRAADGFNVIRGLTDDTIDRFADHVVPLLQERGIFRREYTGTTLREHYNAPFVE